MSLFLSWTYCLCNLTTDRWYKRKMEMEMFEWMFRKTLANPSHILINCYGIYFMKLLCYMFYDHIKLRLVFFLGWHHDLVNISSILFGQMYTILQLNKHITTIVNFFSCFIALLLLKFINYICVELATHRHSSEVPQLQCFLAERQPRIQHELPTPNMLLCKLFHAFVFRILKNGAS